MPRAAKPLPFDAFGEVVRKALSITTDMSISEDTRLREDLGLDSLDLFELQVALEEVSDGRITESEFADIQDMGDLHHYYCQFVLTASDDRVPGEIERQ